MSEGDPTADDTPRWVVVAGGEPTPEELAAVAVALTPVAAATATPEEPGPSVGAAAATPGWARAALLEGVGHRVFVAMPDLNAGRFKLG